MDESHPPHFISTDLCELVFIQPSIGVYLALAKEEIDQLLGKQMVVGQRFALLFSACLADPSYLPLFEKIMKTGAEMIYEEMVVAQDAKADIIREQLKDG